MTQKETNDGITLSLAYRPPYAWDQLIAFLSVRAIPGVESVMEDVYHRTVAVKKGGIVYQGWISVAHMPQINSLQVSAAPGLLPVLSQIQARIRFLFDTNCNPLEIYEKLMVMNKLSPGMCVPGMRLPGCFDPFEMAARAILGQQVTIKAARTLAGRLAVTYGEKITTPFKELYVIFPGPSTIYKLEAPVENRLGPLGITGARARAISVLAEALETGSINLSNSDNPETEMDKLLKLPGFGPWTVQYIAMRALGWPDAFPHTDYGVKKALSGLGPRDILELSEAWRPWRSYAVLNLWNSLAEK